MKQLPVEVDLLSAWYAAFATWDSTINFWISATFAVLVASHTLRKSMTTQLARYMAALYGAFCLYTFLRALSLYAEGSNLAHVMLDHGITFTRFGATVNFLSNLTILVIFLASSFITLKFVFSTTSSDNESDV